MNDRVNGTDSLTQVRDLEGIVKHARRSNPLMDIVLMEFIDPGMFPDYKKGITPVEIVNHELVSGHYRLPSINLAQEVNDKIDDHELSWEDDFKDVHPATFGQELYFQNIKSLFEACFSKGAIENPEQPRALPPPLNSASFTHGSYYDIKNAKYDSHWTLYESWTSADSLPTREGFVKVPVLAAETPGAALSLSFKGTAIGIAVISGADAGIITYSVDKAPFKTADLYTQWSNYLHLPWYILLDSNLHKGSHVLKIRVAGEKNPKSKGNACRIVYFIKND